MANASLDWTPLRDFLAVAEAGSLSGAARDLELSQPTLTRRIAALEERLQMELFRRSSRGLELTEAGEAMLEPARRMQQEAQAALMAVSGRDQALAGPVRITATEGFAMDWLPAELETIRARHPAIEIQILVRNTVLDLLRREADIALRLGRPRQADLVGRKVADLDFGLYASRAYLERAGTPSQVEDLRHHQCVGFDEATRQRGPGAWLEGLLSRGHMVLRSNSIQTQLAAIRQGWGIGGQSAYFAGRHGLVRVLPETRVVPPLWLVTHAGLRRSARIRAVFDHLAERFEARRAELAPSGAGS